jgi:hypothetical protein
MLFIHAHDAVVIGYNTLTETSPIQSIHHIQQNATLNPPVYFWQKTDPVANKQVAIRC